jgi:uncharacterized protein YciI
VIILFVKFIPEEASAREALLPAHHAYLEEHFANGTFLASGPADGGDGVILVDSDDLAFVSGLEDKDPFVRAGVAVYDPIVVTATRTADGWPSRSPK